MPRVPDRWPEFDERPFVGDVGAPTELTVDEPEERSPLVIYGPDGAPLVVRWPQIGFTADR